jgi:hypothetical protein
MKNNPNDVVTNKTLGEAVDAILKGMDNVIFQTKVGFKEVNSCLEKLEADVSYIKDDVKGLKADLSGVPSIKQFNDLNKKVDKFVAS